jgi:hypothetical protein
MNELNYSVKNRPYDAIEIILLGLIFIEVLVKTIMMTKNS